MKPSRVHWMMDWRPPAERVEGYVPNGIVFESNDEIGTAVAAAEFRAELIRRLPGDEADAAELALRYEQLAMALGALTGIDSLGDSSTEPKSAHTIELRDSDADMATDMMLGALRDTAARHHDNDVRSSAADMLTSYAEATARMMLEQQ